MRPTGLIDQQVEINLDVMQRLGDDFRRKYGNAR